LRELTHKDKEEKVEGEEANEIAKINVDDYHLEVFCISANDYLKVAKIKPFMDGPLHTFTKVEDTQIPALRTFVHQTTAKHHAVFCEEFVRMTSDFMARVKLVATDASDNVGSRMAGKCRAAYDEEMNVIAAQLHPIVSAFQTKLQERVRLILQPSLEKGANVAKESAVAIVESWGSLNRRTRQERSLEKNGVVRFVINGGSLCFPPDFLMSMLPFTSVLPHIPCNLASQRCVCVNNYWFHQLQSRAV